MLNGERERKSKEKRRGWKDGKQTREERRGEEPYRGQVTQHSNKKQTFRALLAIHSSPLTKKIMGSVL